MDAGYHGAHEAHELFPRAMFFHPYMCGITCMLRGQYPALPLQLFTVQIPGYFGPRKDVYPGQCVPRIVVVDLKERLVEQSSKPIHLVTIPIPPSLLFPSVGRRLRANVL
jgi:hypothetical protein